MTQKRKWWLAKEDSGKVTLHEEGGRMKLKKSKDKQNIYPPITKVIVTFSEEELKKLGSSNNIEVPVKVRLDFRPISFVTQILYI